MLVKEVQLIFKLHQDDSVAGLTGLLPLCKHQGQFISLVAYFFKVGADLDQFQQVVGVIGMGGVGDLLVQVIHPFDVQVYGPLDPTAILQRQQIPFQLETLLPDRRAQPPLFDSADRGHHPVEVKLHHPDVVHQHLAHKQPYLLIVAAMFKLVHQPVDHHVDGNQRGKTDQKQADQQQQQTGGLRSGS